MAVYTTEALFAGEIQGYFTYQNLTTNPNKYQLSANTFGHFADDPTAKYVPVGFCDIPGLTAEADMDDIYPLGTFQRQQRNMMNFRGGVRLRQDLQNIELLALALRGSNSLLPYASFIVGNAAFAIGAAGAKVETADIDIPRDGKVTVALGLAAVLVAPTSTAPPALTPATDYDQLPVYYGYNAGLLIGSDDYTQYVQRVRIGVRQTIRRLVPLAVNAGTSGSPHWIIVTQSLKETRQVVTVSLDLYQPLPTADVVSLCRSTNNISIPLTDYCNAGRGITITLPNVSFASNNMNEGSTEDIVSFTAEANAQTITIAQTGTG